MERLACEFSLIRYVPDVVKGEFVNIGVLLREAVPLGGSTVSRSEVRFTRDWGRVKCLDADADTGMLESLEQEIAARMRVGVSAHDPKYVLDTLEDSLSNSVQITEAKATLAESMAAEMELLMRMYVEPMKVPRVRMKSGRAAIFAGMRTEFEQVGVWGLMRKRVPAAMYTRLGDPLKIDCGYRVGGATADQIIRMFQAVSLEGDVEAAKGLAFSAPQLREGMERVEKARLDLTAVVEPMGDEDEDRYRFGVETMERQAIRVVTVNELAQTAETARNELLV
jgi:hypothetical protein